MLTVMISRLANCFYLVLLIKHDSCAAIRKPNTDKRETSAKYPCVPQYWESNDFIGR